MATRPSSTGRVARATAPSTRCVLCIVLQHSTAQYSQRQDLFRVCLSMSERALRHPLTRMRACWQGGRDFNALKKFVESTL